MTTAFHKTMFSRPRNLSCNVTPWKLKHIDQSSCRRFTSRKSRPLNNFILTGSQESQNTLSCSNIDYDLNSPPIIMHRRSLYLRIAPNILKEQIFARSKKTCP